MLFSRFCLFFDDECRCAAPTHAALTKIEYDYISMLPIMMKQANLHSRLDSTTSASLSSASLLFSLFTKDFRSMSDAKHLFLSSTMT